MLDRDSCSSEGEAFGGAAPKRGDKSEFLVMCEGERGGWALWTVRYELSQFLFAGFTHESDAQHLRSLFGRCNVKKGNRLLSQCAPPAAISHEIPLFTFRKAASHEYARGSRQDLEDAHRTREARFLPTACSALLRTRQRSSSRTCARTLAFACARALTHSRTPTSGQVRHARKRAYRAHALARRHARIQTDAGHAYRQMQ
eukprot:4969129-Pleurochrysis_carterae.AAC.1